MNSPRLVMHAGLTLNLLQVKCFRLSNFSSIGKRNTLTVEFKTRYDYIQHPATEQWEKQEYNEFTELEFPDYETALAYTNEWIEIWQEYLDEQT
ncbi:MAG: hypothetical protein IR153_06350 [Flavobacterium sp.]|nr:hypothetical protein [Flavobacterium sp.]